MSFAGSASCWKTTGVRTLDHGLGVGRGGLDQACQCRNAGHGQHEGGGDAAGHDHACLALAPAEVVDEGLHMRLRRGTCDLRLERQAGFEAGRVAEVVAAAGLGAHREGEVIEKEAKLLVVRGERPQPCRERAGQRHGESFAPRMRLQFNLRIGPLMNFARNRPPDVPARHESGQVVHAAVGNQPLPRRAWWNRSSSYSCYSAERRAARRNAPRFPLPQVKSSALVPLSALPLDVLLEQCFPLVLSHRRM